MTYRILLVGGGTGGHIYPLIAVSRELQKIAFERGIKLELMAVAENNVWRSEFDSLGIKFKKVFTPKLKKVEGGRLNFFDFFKIPITLIQSLWILFLFMPDLVFSKGGFASVIPSLAAKLYFIPLFIHESDSVPGSANRVLAKFAKKIFISFESSAPYFSAKKTILSGNPVRENLLNGGRNEAAGYFNLDSNKKTILFLGGSQGAAFINNLVIASLVQLVKDFRLVRSLARAKGASPEDLGEATSNGVQIIHQTGSKNFEAVKQEVEGIKKEGREGYGKEIEQNYRVFDFLKEDELKKAYAMGDVVVARAGANLIFEIASLGKSAIVIPYPYAAKNHQKENAREFAKFGAIVLDEGNLKPHILIDQLRHLINNPSVGGRIKQFAKIDAGKMIAQELIGH